MSTWLSNIAESHRVQLAVTAVVSGALVGSAILGLQTAKRQYKVSDLKDSIPSLKEEHEVGKINSFGGATAPKSKQETEDSRSSALAARARNGDYDEDLILEQLARNRAFLTDPGLANLREAFVIVVGCGGVGSHAISALARSGAGAIRLIDFDQVTLSSLNRHAVATLADVGTPKVHTLRKRLEQVTPWTKFDVRNELFGGEKAEWLLGPFEGKEPDYVIDAIDNIDSKVELLAYCRQKGIKVVSSMGAGCKSDPTRVFIGDISASNEDPLSRSTRRRLRMKGIKDGIACIYSQERSGPGKAQLLPLAEEEFAKGEVTELGVLPDFRVRILPVLGTMPAVFGLCAANHVMLEISGYPHDYLPSKGREKMYDSILSGLQGCEERMARSLGVDALGLRLPVTADDVGYLVEEVFHGRSVASGLGSRMALVRWRKPDQDFVDLSVKGQKVDRLKLGDLVLMTRDEALRHEKEVLKGEARVEDLYKPEVHDLVKKRLEEEAHYSQFR
ncbi:tRNA threonylcarbamoyladenosine dehydratase [Elsinoe australis]|uniref:tRNA threonylcarbamoyladenosine dehydratase n=1 Tax=Elsinoe australis TaxID=40998 RepID=A0A2P7ZU25_9PEZI|nr:tRNA threonylcarbamoyladenosine dehydratase [Elsinoe australis]